MPMAHDLDPPSKSVPPDHVRGFVRGMCTFRYKTKANACISAYLSYLGESSTMPFRYSTAKDSCLWMSTATKS